MQWIREARCRASHITTPVTYDEDTTDPAMWGKNSPKQYDTHKLTAQHTKTRYGGHGGSEALPEEKIERDPWLKRMFLGYAFSIDYRDRQGHAYMLQDQEQTRRQTKSQSGSCIHCHASVMPLYRKLGNGDAIAGFEKTYAMSYPLRPNSDMTRQNDCRVREDLRNVIPGGQQGTPRHGEHSPGFVR